MRIKDLVRTLEKYDLDPELLIYKWDDVSEAIGSVKKLRGMIDGQIYNFAEMSEEDKLKLTGVLFI